MANFVRQPPIAVGYQPNGEPRIYIVTKDGTPLRLLTIRPIVVRDQPSAEVDREVVISSRNPNV